jgi:putative Holliday junction resolvase
MRILAVDYGKRRIGVAMTDPLGVISQPLETFAYKTDKYEIARLKCLVRDNDVSVILIGNPISMSGRSTLMSEEVQRFAERLQKTLGIEVKLWDERMTSKYAKTRLQEMGIKKGSKKIDQVVACIMLDEYLKSQSHWSA